jgi:uncharacterized protein (DUF1778 family)
MKARKKDTRLEVWGSEDEYQLVKSAAEWSGMRISQILVDAAVSEAREVTDKVMCIKLTMQGAEQMIATLENPPPVADALLAAAIRHRDRGCNLLVVLHKLLHIGFAGICKSLRNKIFFIMVPRRGLGRSFLR